MKTLLMPTNDLAFGSYPQRAFTTPVSVFENLLRFTTSRPDKRAAVPQALTIAFDAEALICLRLAEDELALRFECLAGQLRHGGLCPELTGRAAAVIAEVMFRKVQQRPYREQLISTWHLLGGKLVEMQTGEGKSLAAGLAATIAAGAGASVLVLTANDYLVTRDQSFLEPVFSALGLSSTVVTHDSALQDRGLLWRADIVYSTARELGFDYLRDHVSTNGQREPAQQRAAMIAGLPGNPPPTLPGLCFGIVDEADALLLDEAGVPLILAAQEGKLDVPGFRRAFAIAKSLCNEHHFQIDQVRRRARLTLAGADEVERCLGQREGVLALWQRAIELVETAICALFIYRRNRDYAVNQEEVVLIDELTGRIATGRQWQGALQAMVEIKEGLEPKAPTRVTAQITFQALFPRFLRLSGMSGTVADSHRELKTLYGLPVVQIPLRKPSANLNKGRLVTGTTEAKLAATIDAVRAEQLAGRPVLVATDSVQDSAILSARLTSAGIAHQQLTAVDCSDEASLIRRAGRASVVTVTTNLAGRGTDIRLSEVSRRNGGLSVIATMANRSRRIDRQLFGRAGRQGDPGSYQSIVSLKDRLVSNALPGLIHGFFCWFHQKSRGRPKFLFLGLVRFCQWIHECRDRSLRTGLRRLNRERTTQLNFSGLAE